MKSRARTQLAPMQGAILTMTGPGLLGFRVPLRPDLGIHDPNTQRSNMVRLLADQEVIAEELPEEIRPGPQLDTIAGPERAALILSLATTICRAEYHEHRFWRITESLVERRRLVAVPVHFDASVPTAIFEAAASLAAARTVVDEIVHIAARRTGRKGWDATKAIKATNVSMKCSETEYLRARVSWFAVLNTYRNVLYHRGWKGEAGAYFPVGAEEPEACDPERNLLLVPDLTSVKDDDTRAHQWTYDEGEHLETVMRSTLDGMRELVDVICVNAWGAKIPPLGRIPTDQQPNIMVGCPRPIPFLGGNLILLPVFSSHEAATAIAGYPPRNRAQLASLPLFTSLFPEPSFALSMAGLEFQVATGRNVTVAVDPTSIAPLNARLTVPVGAELLAKPPFMYPLRLSKAAIGANKVVCWQQQ